jgi:hypothetical protein
VFPGTKEKTKSSELSRELHLMQSVLDHTDNVIMLADTTPDNTIFYMNKAGEQILTALRTRMNKTFRPGVDVANAKNNSIHQFHRDPNVIRRLLADLASGKITKHEAHIPLGDITLATRVYPIWEPDEPGQIRCFMACFKDITAELQTEAVKKENDTRREMLEAKIGELSRDMHDMGKVIE